MSDLYHAGYNGQVTCTNAVRLGSDMLTTLQMFVRFLLHAFSLLHALSGSMMVSLDLLTK
jgi:hypothetical protein